MIMDYRNTIFCPPYEEIDNKKTEISNYISDNHSRARSHYNTIKNDCDLRKKFAKIYNCKCAYCGLHVEIFSYENSEIDHYVHRTSSIFRDNEERLLIADNIRNLIFSCKTCNRAKSSYEISSIYKNKLNPDNRYIKEIFVRNQITFEIDIDLSFSNDENIVKYYNEMKFGQTFRKLDFLCNYLIKLYDYLKENNFPKEFVNQVSESFQKFIRLRNSNGINDCF